MIYVGPIEKWQENARLNILYALLAMGAEEIQVRDDILSHEPSGARMGGTLYIYPDGTILAESGAEYQATEFAAPTEGMRTFKVFLSSGRSLAEVPEDSIIRRLSTAIEEAIASFSGLTALLNTARSILSEISEPEHLDVLAVLREWEDQAAAQGYNQYYLGWLDQNALRVLEIAIRMGAITLNKFEVK